MHLCNILNLKLIKSFVSLPCSLAYIDTSETPHKLSRQSFIEDHDKKFFSRN